MNASSDDLLVVLAKVSARQVNHLIKMVLGTQLNKTSFIERRYTEQAPHFRETLEFLVSLGWIGEHRGELRLTQLGTLVAANMGNDAKLRQDILAALIHSGCPFSGPLSRYVTGFRFQGNELVHRPSVSERNRQRPLRDLLIDLGLVSHRPFDDAFVLEDSARDLFVWARNFATSSRSSFEATQRRRQEIGFAAELSALEYERDRVGPSLAHRVAHVSDELPFACFDIKSITVSEDEIVERYIEVKAVPEESMQFYWPRAEVDAAKVLREKYYLYLVPYIVGRGLDINALRVICNPQKSLLQDSGWTVEEDVLVCSRKRKGREA
jgi:hypothetical protein